MINKLVKIYNDWGDKNNLHPLLSADEYSRYHGDLNEEQFNFIDRFMKVWDKAQEHERKYARSNLR